MALRPCKYFAQTLYVVRCVPIERLHDSHRTRPAHKCSCSLGHAQVISSCGCSPSAGSERRRQADGHGIRAHGCRESWVKQRRVAAGYAARRRSLARWHDVGTVRFAWLLYVHQVRVDGFKQLPRALRCLPMPVRAPLVLEQRRPCLWRPAVDPPVRLSDHMYDVSVSAVRSNRDRAR
jgi:hypothetical protein